MEIERLLHKLHDSILVGSNPTRRQKDFRSNSNTTGGALVNNVENMGLCLYTSVKANKVTKKPFETKLNIFKESKFYNFVVATFKTQHNV